MTRYKKYAIGKLWRISCYLSNTANHNLMPSMDRKTRDNPELKAAYKAEAAKRKAIKINARAALKMIDEHKARFILGEGRSPVDYHGVYFTYWRTRPLAKDSIQNSGAAHA